MEGMASYEIVTMPQGNDTHGGDTKYYYAGAAGLADLNNFYKDIHGYLATIVCVFGIVTNVLNILVLTRRNMISSTNCILTGLAVSDGLTMAVYLPFALRFYCLYGTEPTPERNSAPAVRFMLFFACFSVVVHTVSIWLTLTLAVFRYICVRYPRHGVSWCSLQRAKLAVILVYLVTIIVCIPNFVILTLKGHREAGAPENETVWIVIFRQGTETDRFIHNLNFWIQAILVKLLPCVGLTILSVLLVRTMQRAEKRRLKLRNNIKREESGRDRKTNRTTKMLLTVVVLFLLTEFPQGILSLLSGILPKFVDEVYGPLGDIVDILALINNGINFILYCAMSKQFRDTFIALFLSSLKIRAKQFNPMPQSTYHECDRIDCTSTPMLHNTTTTTM